MVIRLAKVACEPITMCIDELHQESVTPPNESSGADCHRPWFHGLDHLKSAEFVEFGGNLERNIEEAIKHNRRKLDTRSGCRPAVKDYNRILAR